MGRVGKGGGGSCQDGWEVMTRWGGEADANGLLTLGRAQGQHMHPLATSLTQKSS